MVKCTEVLQCSDVLLVYFYCFVYGCIFCILLFNSVIYIFLVLDLYILIDMYALFCIFFANWHSSATLTEVFSVLFPQLLGKCQDTPRKDGARSALFPISELYCFCVNVYCTTATGCQRSCSCIYHSILIIINWYQQEITKNYG
jgi:hypothetical protein